MPLDEKEKKRKEDKKEKEVVSKNDKTEKKEKLSDKENGSSNNSNSKHSFKLFSLFKSKGSNSVAKEASDNDKDKQVLLIDKDLNNLLSKVNAWVEDKAVNNNQKNKREKSTEKQCVIEDINKLKVLNLAAINKIKTNYQMPAYNVLRVAALYKVTTLVDILLSKKDVVVVDIGVRGAWNMSQDFSNESIVKTPLFNAAFSGDIKLFNKILDVLEESMGNKFSLLALNCLSLFLDKPSRQQLAWLSSEQQGALKNLSSTQKDELRKSIEASLNTLDGEVKEMKVESNNNKLVKN